MYLKSYLFLSECQSHSERRRHRECDIPSADSPHMNTETEGLGPSITAFPLTGSWTGNRVATGRGLTYYATVFTPGNWPVY